MNWGQSATQRREMPQRGRAVLATIGIILVVLLGCAALLAFNYFFFADVGLEVPPTLTTEPAIAALPLTRRIHVTIETASPRWRR
jgi:hypothetical protein